MDPHSAEKSTNKPDHQSNRDVEYIDINTPGGKKIMVKPVYGGVDNEGRVHLHIKRSTGPEIRIARGELEDLAPPLEQIQEQKFDLDIRNKKKGLRFANANVKSGIPALDELSAAGVGGSGRGAGTEGAAHELSAMSEQGRQFQDFLQSPGTVQPGSGPGPEQL